MSAPTRWRSIPRIAAGTDTETSVRVGERLPAVSPHILPGLLLQGIILFSLAATVDHSRVKLKNTENDYINASLVVMEEAQRSYILTQASVIPKERDSRLYRKLLF